LKLSVALALLVITLGASAHAQNEAWDSRFDANGMSGHVRAIAFAPNGHVFAGGLFTTAGGDQASRVAEWDGATWSALGTNGVSSDVYAIAVDSQNNVYVGGSFTTAGGNIAGRIAKWNGIAWTDLDGGMSDEVYAIAVDDDDNVYAGGKFTNAGGVVAGRIAMWDGSDWSDLDGGMSDIVYALTTVGNVLYAGGVFTVAGSTSAFRVAMWDGDSWSALGTGVTGEVWALAAAANGNIYAGGKFTTAGAITAGRIARWNGITWSDLDGGLSNEVFAIATSGTSVYAGGIFTTAGGNPAFRIAKWDGFGWSNLGDGVSERVWAVAASGQDVFVGGEFTTAGGKTSLYIGRHNPAIVPVFVQAFTANPIDDRVHLEWRVWADEEVAGYRVYRSHNGEDQFVPLNAQQLLPATTTTFTDTAVRSGTIYHYRLAAVLPDGTETLSRTIEARVPQTTFVLEQNFPNPFNPITTIRFAGPRGVPVRVVVYDVDGGAVASLFNGISPGGETELQWNGRDASGRPVGSGVYFYRLRTGDRTITRKMLLLK
jgi:hypothetical protein